MKLSAAVVILLTLTGCSSSNDTDPVIPPDPNEPEQPAGEALDSDQDGDPDATDTDDDNDGFLDANDPFPLDQTVPGDFSTPEAILNQPLIQNAIRAASEQGFTIEPLTGENPPDIGGYYREEENSTVFVATDNGDSVGGTRLGAEFRYDQLPDNTINGAVVNYNRNEPASFSLSFASLLRGLNQQFTRYSRSSVTCTVNNSDYTVLFVGISTADVDELTGDFVDRDRISVSVGTSGTPTESCNNQFAGGAEQIGGWSASQAARIFRTQANTFQHMCVDDDRAFAPTETWTSNDGSDCVCNRDFSTTCQ